MHKKFPKSYLFGVPQESMLVGVKRPPRQHLYHHRTLKPSQDNVILLGMLANLKGMMRHDFLQVCRLKLLRLLSKIFPHDTQKQFLWSTI